MTVPWEQTVLFGQQIASETDLCRHRRQRAVSESGGEIESRTGEEDENFEEWQVIPAVQIGMTQHEPIFKCTKRAVEKILF